MTATDLRVRAAQEVPEAEDNSKSQAVLALTNDESRAKSSVRISISHLTTKEELDAFVSSLKIALKNYDFLS